MLMEMIRLRWRWLQSALAYRQKFQEDVVIDINCYRKHGHNEADDPAFTQPILYKRIKQMPSISSILTDQLVKDGDLDKKQSDEIHQRLRRQLDATLERVKTIKKSSTFEGSVAIRQIPYDFAPAGKPPWPRKIWKKWLGL